MDFFKRNKKYLLISLGVLAIGLLIGFVYGYMTVGYQGGIISNAVSASPTKGVKAPLSPLDLFIHNFSVGIVEIIGGIFVSVLSVIITLVNGFTAGMLYGIDFKFALAGVTPHGIFEYGSHIFGLTGAFIITKVEIAVLKSNNKLETLKSSKREFKDVLICALIVLVLLVIAAIIEAYYTDIFLNMLV